MPTLKHLDGRCHHCSRKLPDTTQGVYEIRIGLMGDLGEPADPAKRAERMGLLCSRRCVSEWLQGDLKRLDQSMTCFRCGEMLHWIEKIVGYRCGCRKWEREQTVDG